MGRAIPFKEIDQYLSGLSHPVPGCLIDPKIHWEEIYSEKAPTEASWYQERPALSFRLIEESGVGKDQWIIDVGAGASTLTDHLLSAGFKNITVLDISAAAMQSVIDQAAFFIRSSPSKMSTRIKTW